MGWRGHNIMEGDPPLDWECRLADEHAQHDDDRKACIDAFEQHVLEYDGTPQTFRDRGLFEVIVERSKTRSRNETPPG